MNKLKKFTPKLLSYGVAAMIGILMVKSCDVDYKPEVKRLNREIDKRDSKIKDLDKETKILIKTIKKIEDDYKINDSIIVNNSDSANRELLSKYLSMP